MLIHLKNLSITVFSMALEISFRNFAAEIICTKTYEQNALVGRFNIVKTSVLPNFIYRFNAIPIKIPASYFMNINKVILKFTCRGKRLRIANTILKEKNNVWGLTPPDFKPSNKVIVNKTVVIVVKEETNRSQKKTESSGIDLHKQMNWSLIKDGRQYKWSKDSLSTNGTGATGHLHTKKWI